MRILQMSALAEQHPWFKVFTQARKSPLSKSSRKVYGAWWARYLDFLTAKGLEPGQASSSDVYDFLEGYPGNTGIRYCRLLSEVYEAALNHELCTVNPVEAVVLEVAAKEEDPVPVVATAGPVFEALYSIKPKRSHWKHSRDRAMVLLAAETGLRRQDLIALQLRQLDLVCEPATLTVTAGQNRTLALSSKLQTELASWLDIRRAQAIAPPLVFPSNLAGAELDPSTAYRIIERHLAQVGAGKSVHGTSGAQLLRSGVANREWTRQKNVQDVKNALGHRQLSSSVDLVGRLAPLAVAEPKLEETTPTPHQP